MANKGKYYESDYEEAFVLLMQENGWTYTFGEDIQRKYTDALIEEDLMQFLRFTYGSRNLTDSDFNTFVANLRNASGDTEYLSLYNAFKLYHEGQDKVDGNGDSFKLIYIDFDNPKNNIFRCVNQFEMHQGNENRRPDVMLFINGIPVCIVELKNPVKKNATIRDAHTQINTRYWRDIPELMKYCVLGCISDGSNTRLGSPISNFEYFYAWKKVNNEDEVASGIDELRTLIKGAFSPERILEIIRDYVYFPDLTEDHKEIEVVCRYPQFFAARKLRDHIITHLRSNGGDGKGGTYFGATGCGKTYTMLFLARQLAMRCKAQLDSPTIILIVDREDLETQAGKLFCNSKTYLGDNAVEVFESRTALADELSERESGGFYVTTIQKFSESTGLLSNRSNIVCMSDEAHRTQNNTGAKLRINDGGKDESDSVKKNDSKIGAFITYGFAKYLRDALPNATYVGFTGTPIDSTIHVFGEIVDQYTMRQAKDDDITVPIKYDARLARVFLNEEQIKAVEAYYGQCAEEGASEEEIKKSKKAMSSLQVILADEERLQRVAADIVQHYEKFCDDDTSILRKAMITCSDRQIAYRLYKMITALRPEWAEKRKAVDESALAEEQLHKLEPTRFINVVATRSSNDPKEMYDFLGDDAYKKTLDAQFKDDNSNFRIAIVVDMWITGFDCPSLTVLYNDKPLQKHTLIQTISRVNRKYLHKEFGLIVDYIGIRENMKKALKQYGGDPSPKEDVDAAYDILKNELSILKDLTNGLDFSPFFGDVALARLQFLQTATDFILNKSKEEPGKVSLKSQFRGHVKRMKSAFSICSPAGVLNEDEVQWCQCFMGIMSFINKISNTQIDVETMNRAVERMVKEALSCTGVERILDIQEEEEIFGDALMRELEDVKAPNTKFQLLAKLLRKAITEYGKTNKVKARKFLELLEETVDEYNTRDKLTFANDVATEAVTAITDIVGDKISDLTDKLIDIFNELKKDKDEFKNLGISFEEKAFYDILIDIRNRNKFEYPDDKCKLLAVKINELIANTAIYANWLNNNNLKDNLSSELAYLLYKEGYPPEWSDEVFENVIDQVNNFKKYH